MTQKKRRQLPTESITAERLREILAGQVLGRGLRMPGDDELEELAAVLDAWRQRFVAEQELEPIRQAQRNAMAALATLGQAVDVIGQDNRRFAVAVAIGDIRRNIRNIKASPLWGSPMLSGINGWKWLGETWREDFVTAMRPRNPGFDPGLSRNGPLARFITAAAPMVTGERPTRGSVASQLKVLRRLKQDGLPGKTETPATFPP